MEEEERNAGAGAALERRHPAAAPPEDAGNRAYWMCFLLGAGILFPWNAYITAVGAVQVERS
jgi:hypothetical protein